MYTLKLAHLAGNLTHHLSYTRKMSSNDYVRLESSDGYTFVVARSVACASGMLKTSLDSESKW